MKRADLSIEEYRHVAAPAPLVWALACDSNRFDRIIGAPPSSYEFDLVDAPGGPVRGRVGSARFFWGEARWVESGEWIEGRMIRGERRFIGGLIAVAGFEVQLEPVGDEVDVRISYYLEARTPLDEGMAALVKRKSQERLGRYLDALAAVLEGSRIDARASASEPAAAWARRVIATTTDGALFLGPRGETSETELALRARRAAGDVDAALLDHMVTYLRERTDDELQQIRPFELAAVWGLARRDVLAGFLHASRAGLFDMRWQTICPSCRVGSALHDGLAEVGAQSYCEACDAHFVVDFAANIEAVFQANAAIRPTAARVWCASSPWFRPHVFAVSEVPPGEWRELPAVPAEALLVHSTRGNRAATVDGTRGAEVHLGPDGMTVTPGAIGGALRLHNSSDHLEQVFIERAAYQPQAALGNELVTLPEFHDLFAMDAPSAGVDLGVSAVAILFCDLTASTALYRDIGDGRAFAIINDHFNALGAIVDQHRGAVLKTMGDAVMAAFLSSADAMAAAVEMIRAVAALHAHHDMRLKIGLHEGPALAVRANQRLDFFGTTVNLAARLQEEAGADQIVLAEALLEHPEIAALTERAGRLERQQISPKGLPPLPCVKLTVAL